MKDSHNVIFIPTYSGVNEQMVTEFAELLGLIDIRKLKRKLRAITLNFVANESQYLSDNIHEFLYEFNVLFDFLDVVEDEMLKEKTV